MFYEGKPQFLGVKEAASNIGSKTSNYDADMFKQDFPQFFNSDGMSLLPENMLELFINRACAAIQPDKWLDLQRYACGLYTAHYATLYLRTYAPSSSTPAQAASSGALVGVMSSAKLGDASVSYDVSALTKATENWGSLNATQYGQLLATEARLAGLGGTVVI